MQKREYLIAGGSMQPIPEDILKQFLKEKAVMRCVMIAGNGFVITSISA